MLETTITIPAAARGGGRDCGLSLADGGNSPAPPPPALVGHRYCLPLHRQTLKRHAAGTAWPWLPLSALCQSRPHRRCCSCGLEGYLPQSIPADISHSLAALVSNNIAKSGLYGGRWAMIPIGVVGRLDLAVPGREEGYGATPSPPPPMRILPAVPGRCAAKEPAAAAEYPPPVAVLIRRLPAVPGRELG